jgi:hypothetical protein
MANVPGEAPPTPTCRHEEQLLCIAPGDPATILFCLSSFLSSVSVSVASAFAQPKACSQCCRYCSVSGGRGGCPLSDGVDALCRPHPLARGKAEADRGDVRGRPRIESQLTERVRVQRPRAGFYGSLSRRHSRRYMHLLLHSYEAHGATMTRAGFDDAACADRSSVLSRMPRTSRSIATLFEAPRGTTTSAWRFVGSTNSSNAGLTNVS